MGMIIQNGKQYFPVYNDSEIKALPTVSTASGSIATFDTDMTENLVEVKCQIVAQQSGSGTPSPSNPRPITTFSEMNVSACGKNFIDENSGNIEQGTIDGGSGANVSATNRVRNINKIPFPFDDLYSNYKLTIPSGWKLAMRFYKADGTFIPPYNAGFTTSLPSDILGKGAVFVRWVFAKNDDSTITTSDLADIQYQLEKGSTATAYAPYNGTTSNIPFGQTVANGVLDVTTGVLEITHGVADMGTLPWELAATQTGHWWFRANVPNVAKAGGNSIIPDIKCEVYETITPNNAYTGNMGITSNASADNYLHATDENYSDVTSFTGAVNGKKVVYKLVNPVIVQLDSTQIQALLNENNIWCDTGDTEVKYLLSVGKKIA